MYIRNVWMLLDPDDQTKIQKACYKLNLYDAPLLKQISNTYSASKWQSHRQVPKNIPNITAWTPWLKTYGQLLVAPFRQRYSSRRLHIFWISCRAGCTATEYNPPYWSKNLDEFIWKRYESTIFDRFRMSSIITRDEGHFQSSSPHSVHSGQCKCELFKTTLGQQKYTKYSRCRSVWSWIRMYYFTEHIFQG